MGGNNSVVECNLAKVEVAGSNPVSRSKKLSGILMDSAFFWATFTNPFTKDWGTVRDCYCPRNLLRKASPR